MEMIAHFLTGDTHRWILSKVTLYTMMRLSDVIEITNDNTAEEEGLQGLNSPSGVKFLYW